MAKFVFRLEKVLSVRTFEKEQLEHELGKLRSELVKEKDSLKKLYIEQRNAAKKLEQLMNGILDMEEVTICRNYITDLFNKIDVQKDVIIQVSDQLEQKKEQVIEATKKVKVLEKLKDKQFKDFQKEQERVEEKELDEVGKNQFLRKKRASTRLET